MAVWGCVETSQARPQAAKPDTFHPDDDPACAALATLTAETRQWMIAATPQPHHRKVAALWPTLPATCRGGTYFLVAAELVGHAADAHLVTADHAVEITSPSDALAQGLIAEPDHPRLLAHLAFAQDVQPQGPTSLPGDACERVRARRGEVWTDDAAYVCALAALHAGDGTVALDEVNRVRNVARFPDLQVRRAQALALTGKRDEALSLATAAADAIAKATPRFDLTPAARAALVRKLPTR